MEARRVPLAKPFTLVLVLASSFLLVQSTRAQSFNVIHNTLPKLVLDGFLRRQELAQQLGLSPRTIDRWEALRKGPPRVCVGRTI